MASNADSGIENQSAEQPIENFGSSIFHKLHWIPANMQRLAQLETQILSKLSASSVVRKYVSVGERQQIWTLIARRLESFRHAKSMSSLSTFARAAGVNTARDITAASKASTVLQSSSSNAEIASTVASVIHPQQAVASADAEYESRTPLVLVHGMGAAASLFIKNIDDLASRRVIYAFDLPGFGRSSRPRFPDDAEEVERQFVDSIERWRVSMNLDEFIMLGHSLGGYLATSYAAAHPERVKHLILAEPWGFPRSPDNQDHLQQFPFVFRMLVRVVSPTFPFALLRFAGPFGPGLVERFRPDLQRMYADVLEDNTVLEYIYECNALRPSGENAFKALSAQLGWAKRPQIDRVQQLSPRLGMTFIYGEHSWIDSASGYQTRALRPQSFVNVFVLPKAGHHVMAQQAELFNAAVNRTCDAVDKGTLASLLEREHDEPEDQSGVSTTQSRPTQRTSRSDAPAQKHTVAQSVDVHDSAQQGSAENGHPPHERGRFFPANQQLSAESDDVQVRSISF